MFIWYLISRVANVILLSLEDKFVSYPEKCVLLVGSTNTQITNTQQFQVRFVVDK